MQIDDGITTESSTRRFGGVARLYGPDALERFSRSRVAVVGVGGVGSWAAEALVRSGIGAVVLIDMDHVSESNINRQLHALDGEIGRAKIEVMAERLLRINPGCQVTLVDDFLSEDNCASLLEGCDAVIDAVDAVRAKCAMAVETRRRHVPFVMCGGAGGKRDASSVRVVDLRDVRNDPLLSKVRAQLRREFGFAKGSASKPSALFGFKAVFVDAPAVPAPQDCAPGSPLNCEGYGSAMHVTASVGMGAVGATLEALRRCD